MLHRFLLATALTAAALSGASPAVADPEPPSGQFGSQGLFFERIIDSL